MAIPPQVTILFDNYPGLPGLEALWGFSALVRTQDLTILFDTGSNGRVLLRNMVALGVDPSAIDLLFLSHPHWDHIGGLDSVLEVNPHMAVAVHEGFSKHLVRDLSTQCRELVIVGTEPRQLAPGIFSTGILDGTPPEQSLIMDSQDTVALISGCAHPGMERVVERASDFLGKKIDWAIGGFHLMYADGARIEHSIRSLQNLGVRFVAPTHCTGDKALAAFRHAYSSHCVFGGVGRKILLGKEKTG